LTDNFCTSCRNCQAVTPTVRSIRHIEHGAAKNETDERESRRTRQRARISSADTTVSFLYLEQAVFQLPRSTQKCSVQTCRSFFSPHLLSYQRNATEAEQWSANWLDSWKDTEGQCLRCLCPILPPSVRTLFSLQHCSVLTVYPIGTRKYSPISASDDFIVIDRGSSCWDHLLFQIGFDWSWAEIQAPRHHVLIQSDHRDAICWRIFVENTKDGWYLSLQMQHCSGTPCTLHIYVLIVLHPAWSINVVLFQLLEWQKYAAFPVCLSAQACGRQDTMSKSWGLFCK